MSHIAQPGEPFTSLLLAHLRQLRAYQSAPSEPLPAQGTDGKLTQRASGLHQSPASYKARWCRQAEDQRRALGGLGMSPAPFSWSAGLFGEHRKPVGPERESAQGQHKR